MQERITEALRWRYAVNAFDSSKKVSRNDLQTILESARLAPSSIGLEPWKFIVVENPELRGRIREASYGQPKVTEASHLVVIARRTDVRENIARERLERTAQAQHQDIGELDGLKRMIEGSIAMRDDATLDAWMARQVFIPLGIMVETASLLGIDSAPMDGFDPAAVDEILGLKAKHLASTALLAIGYRGADPAETRPKVRRAFDEVVEFAK